VFLGLYWATAALADSWTRPVQQTYLSPNGQYRLTVIPNRAFVRHFSDESDSLEHLEGTAHGRLERRRANGRWSLVWTAPLRNEVAPAGALVDNSGTYAVTFDNWGGVGVGDNVVVIYGPGGRLVRSLRLDEILPLDYIMTLPHTFSSLWWGGFSNEHYIAAGGDRLVLKVAMPGESPFADGFVDVNVDLATGRPEPLVGAGWERALAAAAPIRARQREAEARRAAFLSEPLVGPASNDEQQWNLYLIEAFRRVDPDWENAPSSIVLPEGGVRDLAASVRTVIARLRPQNRAGMVFVFGSPDQGYLADVLGAAVGGSPPENLRGLRIYIAAPDDLWPRFEEMFAATGAQIIQIDPTEPIPQRPERLPPAA
jgi:hypothetical protein